ncbi:hypothetical protein [Alicyclobacillus fastidiosus]|uniref:hypothetical protein n=1 Tax=Alicyclobacillus fastidiosus TaxID=392011 RepID=UPI0023EA2512|nr:hypothetical protein [Alicyclobacillus fastidiosus]GMA65976.1 hypothetical protein GCM10025859_64180 [Alicyclobacillus fastidiosus]GMA66196.1 hypothetical protein GCM10025859_66380 [Alicyclobacillus fastidiosus]
MADSNMKEEEVLSFLKTDPVWERLRSAMENKSDDEVEEIMRHLIRVMENSQKKYVKKTYEVRDDLYDEMKLYCVRNNITQKVFLNIAIEVLLRWKTDV